MVNILQKVFGHTEESKKKMSESKTGITLNLSDETRAKLVVNCNRVLNNPEQKEKTAALNRTRKGPLSWAYGRKPTHSYKVWYERSDGTQICFRSSWEAAFAKWLDDKHIAWEYEQFTFPITYTIDGQLIEGTYTPDFKTVDGWYEVKGYWTKEGKAKYQAFIQQYSEFVVVIDRQWLKQENILPKRSK